MDGLESREYSDKEGRMMAALRVISADPHMIEPADLWVERLDKHCQDGVPQLIKHPKKPGYLFAAPGINPFAVAGGFARGMSGQELKEHTAKRDEAARPAVGTRWGASRTKPFKTSEREEKSLCSRTFWWAPWRGSTR
jgi:hypothetical protein